jgi:hypothetical protein
MSLTWTSDDPSESLSSSGHSDLLILYGKKHLLELVGGGGVLIISNAIKFKNRQTIPLLQVTLLHDLFTGENPTPGTLFNKHSKQP